MINRLKVYNTFSYNVTTPGTSTVAVFKTITSSNFPDSRRSQTERSKRLNMSILSIPTQSSAKELARRELLCKLQVNIQTQQSLREYRKDIKII